jgi:hypothetical protein
MRPRFLDSPLCWNVAARNGKSRIDDAYAIYGFKQESSWTLTALLIAGISLIAALILISIPAQ